MRMMAIKTESGGGWRRLWWCQRVSRVVPVETRWTEIGGVGGGMVCGGIMKERK